LNGGQKGRRGQGNGGQSRSSRAGKPTLAPESEAAPEPQETWRDPQASRCRSLDAGMFIASRYFATVLRATVTPDCLSSAASRASDSGRHGSSCSINRLSMAWMAVLEAVPPSVVDRLEEKKCLNSKVPRGVCRYLRVVTREIVDSCRDSSSAISRRVSGRIASGPCSRKPVCWRTMRSEERRVG